MIDEEVKALCPFCFKTSNQVKAGKNTSGTQRYKCNNCYKRYTFQPKKRVYSSQFKEQVINNYNKNNKIGIRGMARVMRINKGTVSNWLKADKLK